MLYEFRENESFEEEFEITNDNLIYLSAYDALIYLLDKPYSGKRLSYLERAIKEMEDEL